VALFDLDAQLDSMFLRSIGFESDNNTANTSTAVDQINKNFIISPDILNNEWVTTLYSVILEVVMQLFYIVIVIWCICFIVNRVGGDVNSYSSATVFLKRSIIAMIMIYCGPAILMWLILINEEISYIFGFSGLEITVLLVTCLTSGYGSIITGMAAAGTMYLALFYIIRLYLIILSIGLWVLGWMLWVAGSSGLGIAQRLENLSTFILTFVVLNIFLGAAMCFVFRVGILFMSFTADDYYLVEWGMSLSGLLIIFVSGMLPLLLFIWLIYNPTTIVNNVVKVVV